MTELTRPDGIRSDDRNGGDTNGGATGDGDTGELLQELRKRVRYLLQEIRRLRAENARMTERLDELEERVGHDGTLLMLDDEPEALKKQIKSYIRTIDEQLGER